MASQGAQSYEEEQAKLRRQYGLEDSNEEEPEFDPRIPEVNPEIYKDVEPVLFRGFLTLPAVINGVPFTFKSLNQHELARISMSTSVVGQGDMRAIQKGYDYYLAYGVLLVDGRNVLVDRDSHVPELVDFFAGCHREVRGNVIRMLSEINRRANKATVLTEAFAMEARSRLMWFQTRGLDISSSAVTGFSGTEHLGLNWAQLTWRAINYIEDQREVSEREWENTKFIASAWAGKGMQKVYSSDKRRRQGERDERVSRREKVIRHAILGSPLDGGDQHGPIKVARTVTELATQLERDIKGEQDWHDKVIAEHERRASQNYYERVAEVQRIRDEHVAKFGDHPVVVTSEMGLTPQQVSERKKQRQEMRARGLAAQARYPELHDPKYEALTKKWLVRDPSSQPTIMSPTEDPRPRGKPFRGGKS